LKRGTKALGTLVLAAGVLGLYLAVANFLQLFDIASMPLQGGLSNDLVFPLILLAILGSIIVNKRRSLENVRPPEDATSN
jgi:hypothetical protein